MKVPVVQLGLDEQTVKDAAEVLKSGMWADGKNVKALEEEFARYIGAKHARAVNNGTAALICALYGVGIKPGDEVLVPSFTFIATSNTILECGAKPVFVDVDRGTFNMSVEDAKKKVTKKTRAIMPVHLYGLSVDMDGLKEIATKNNLKIIEDACQAHGAGYKGKKVGGIGDVAAFSLYPTKNMVCGGEGGIVTTNDDEVMNRVKLYANHGQAQKYVHASIGFNFRMQEVNGVIARASLKLLDANNKKRQENAAFYNAAFKGVSQVETPIVPAGYEHVYHQYTLKVKNRDKLAQHLQKNEIGYGIHYGIPIHEQQSMKSAGITARLPVTEALAKEVISLPVHPLLSREQLDFVAKTIKSFYA
ncbi:MAG: DegT/DnrJ/EryC1/StrS family aminotransferase [Candidatus Lokiarchaeota archaeon]|nr:DegT/DnrJ/EryC1/StrS family aminotransferase [Candidatus Lokiarchaeota archaeon]